MTKGSKLEGTTAPHLLFGGVKRKVLSALVGGVLLLSSSCSLIDSPITFDSSNPPTEVTAGHTYQDFLANQYADEGVSVEYSVSVTPINAPAHNYNFPVTVTPSGWLSGTAPNAKVVLEYDFHEALKSFGHKGSRDVIVKVEPKTSF